MTRDEIQEHIADYLFNEFGFLTSYKETDKAAEGVMELLEGAGILQAEKRGIV